MNQMFLLFFIAIEACYNALYFDNISGQYKERKTHKTDQRFRRIGYLVLQIAAPLVLFLTLCFDNPALEKIYDGESSKYVGLCFSIVALVVMRSAKKTLSKNYSPCQDSYLPFSVTLTGPYRHVRHPLYAANMLFFFGLTIASGSAWSILIFVALSGFFWRSALVEESILSEKFDSYVGYKSKTKRFIPFLF